MQWNHFKFFIFNKFAKMLKTCLLECRLMWLLHMPLIWRTKLFKILIICKGVLLQCSVLEIIISEILKVLIFLFFIMISGQFRDFIPPQKRGTWKYSLKYRSHCMYTFLDYVWFFFYIYFLKMDGFSFCVVISLAFKSHKQNVLYELFY